MRLMLVAPHPDDEVIGAYRLLEQGIVTHVCFIDVDTDEYRASAERFGFEPITNWARCAELATNVDGLLVPDPYETHPLHKEAYVLGRKLALSMGLRLGLYSTEMRASYVDLLPRDVAKRKRDALDEIYVSKSDMWRYEHRYWLYEGVVLRL